MFELLQQGRNHLFLLVVSILLNIKAISQITQDTITSTPAKTGTTIPNLLSNYTSTVSNYVRTCEANKVFTNVTEVIGSTDATLINSLTKYFDGLGRSLQRVSTKLLPNQTEIGRPVIPDELGKEKVLTTNINSKPSTDTNA